jgi:hypothetical protein
MEAIMITDPGAIIVLQPTEGLRGRAEHRPYAPHQSTDKNYQYT